MLSSTKMFLDLRRKLLSRKAFQQSLREAASRSRYRPQFEFLEDRRVLANYVVSNTGDAGAGSLRQAILDANGNGGADTIQFNIGGGGVKTIAPLSALPFLSDLVTIDGYSQPGSSANSVSVGSNAVLLIELTGSGTTAGGALTFASGSEGSTLRGLVINRWDVAGAYSVNVVASNVTLAGNFFGRIRPAGPLTTLMHRSSSAAATL